MPLQHPLSTRFADLPLILCGPFLRRVEPDIISVWVALKSSRSIILNIYTGYCDTNAADFASKTPAFVSEKTTPITVGDNLHIALVTIDKNVTLTPGGIYSYNLVFFTGENETESLVSLNLLKQPDLLGFVENQLPSFVAAPEKIEDLRIAHGSCRKPHGLGRDALAILATTMQPDFTDADRILAPKSRPHYLFHTGDQIYADDCNDYMIQHYTDAGNFLLQKAEELPFPKAPEQDYSKQVDKDENFVWIELSGATFPPGRRSTNYYSGFTGDPENHLLSFAEFCAAYIFQWSDVLWLEKFFNADTQKDEYRYIDLPDSKDLFKDRVNDNKETRPYLLGMAQDKKLRDGETAEVPEQWDNMSDTGRAARLFPEPTEPILAASMKSYITRHQKEKDTDPPKQKERVEEFRNGMKAVRRAMANTPSLMNFDDHDITDDWYLTGGWTKRVLGNRLGETIIRNGLLAFTLFQAWGNDPKAWADTTAGKDERNKLLNNIPKFVALFKPLNDTANPGLVSSTARSQEFKDMVTGFHKTLGFESLDKPPITWHFSLKAGPVKVFVLDTRTRRDFSAGLDFPPNLLRKTALEEQLPDNAMPVGAELAIVISGAPVLGLAVMESITQPFASRITQIKRVLDDDFDVERRTVVNASRRSVKDSGSESADVEHWSIHEAGFEALLKRCATLKKVIFLAGDVHYGISSEMDYWPKGEPEAARFLQMVSSSLKNVKPEGQMLGILPAALVQTALAGGLNKEFSSLSSVGWEKEEDVKKLKLRFRQDIEPDTFTDARPGQFPATYAYALSKQPASISLRDWPLKEYQPKNTTDAVKVLPSIVFNKDCPDPSFRWKMNVLLDERTDEDRYHVLAESFPNLAADLPTNEHNGDVYTSTVQQVVLRNAFFSRNHTNRFINWYSHIGIVHFERKSDELFALHSMFFIPQLPAPDDKQTGNMDFPFFRHRASLGKKPATAQPAFPLEGST